MRGHAFGEDPDAEDWHQLEEQLGSPDDRVHSNVLINSGRDLSVSSWPRPFRISSPQTLQVTQPGCPLRN